MDKSLKKEIEAIFFQARYTDLVRGLSASEAAIEVLRQPLALIQSQGSRVLEPLDWLNYLEGSSQERFLSLSPADLALLDKLNSLEWYLVYRWLLDRTLAFYGAGDRHEGLADAVDLVNLTTSRLKGYCDRRQLVDIIESYLSQVGEASLNADLYSMLFSLTFSPTESSVEVYLYALRGLEHAQRAGDPERLSWAWYNLAYYLLYQEGAEARKELDKALEHVDEARYMDLLGSLAVREMDGGDRNQARARLETVAAYFRKMVEAALWEDLEPILFNLVYYQLNLGWLEFDDRRFEHAQVLLDGLAQLLREHRDVFLSLEDGLESEGMDIKYTYYTYYLDCLLWAYAALVERQAPEAEVSPRLNEIKDFIRRCSYNLESLVDEFFEDRGWPNPL